MWVLATREMAIQYNEDQDTGFDNNPVANQNILLDYSEVGH